MLAGQVAAEPVVKFRLNILEHSTYLSPLSLPTPGRSLFPRWLCIGRPSFCHLWLRMIRILRAIMLQQPQSAYVRVFSHHTNLSIVLCCRILNPRRLLVFPSVPVVILGMMRNHASRRMAHRVRCRRPRAWRWVRPIAVLVSAIPRRGLPMRWRSKMWRRRQGASRLPCLWRCGAVGRDGWMSRIARVWLCGWRSRGLRRRILLRLVLCEGVQRVDRGSCDGHWVPVHSLRWDTGRLRR